MVRKSRIKTGILLGVLSAATSMVAIRTSFHFGGPILSIIGFLCFFGGFPLLFLPLLIAGAQYPSPWVSELLCCTSYFLYGVAVGYYYPVETISGTRWMRAVFLRFGLLLLLAFLWGAILGVVAMVFDS